MTLTTFFFVCSRFTYTSRYMSEEALLKHSEICFCVFYKRELESRARFFRRYIVVYVDVIGPLQTSQPSACIAYGAPATACMGCGVEFEGKQDVHDVPDHGERHRKLEEGCSASRILFQKNTSRRPHRSQTQTRSAPSVASICLYHYVDKVTPRTVLTSFMSDFDVTVD